MFVEYALFPDPINFTEGKKVPNAHTQQNVTASAANPDSITCCLSCAVSWHQHLSISITNTAQNLGNHEFSRCEQKTASNMNISHAKLAWFQATVGRMSWFSSTFCDVQQHDPQLHNHQTSPCTSNFRRYS